MSTDHVYVLKPHFLGENKQIRCIKFLLYRVPRKALQKEGLPSMFARKLRPRHGDGTQTQGTRGSFGSFAVGMLLGLVELHQGRKDVLHLTFAN